MGRFAVVAFGAAAYLAFLVSFVYLAVFLAGAPAAGLVAAVPWLAQFGPHTVDTGGPAGGTLQALAVDLALLLTFGLQHSLMARAGFKAWLARRAPRAVERSVYVLASSLCLALLFWLWRPLPAVVWRCEAGWAAALAWTVFGAGALLALVASFLIDHLGLFGLKQVWRHLRGAALDAPRFVTPRLYRFVRHPLYLGWCLMFWGAPVMTVGHLLFAATMCGYILLAIRYEERDLVRAHGERYVRYRAAVPMLVPMPGRRWPH